MPPQRVVIIGGGVAGMSAAHELGERGFDVEVFEMKPIPGGKARSMLAPRTGSDGRKDLPGEHGFRFFPGFYRHLPDTLRRIPCGDGCPKGHTVEDHLVAATQMQFARRNTEPAQFRFDSPFPSLTSPFTALRFLFDYRRKLRIPEAPFGFFVLKLLEMMLRSDQWYGKYEEMSWMDFSGAATRYKDNRPYNRYLARAITRTMVAARADEISARTAGCVAVKLIESLSRAAGTMDRVLDGPTNDAWIKPWLAYLRSKNVKYHLGQPVHRINCRGNRIIGVTLDNANGPRVKGDYYIAALPVEKMRSPLVTQALRDADPMFSTLHQLRTRWMNGVMLYLREDVPQIRGHSIYLDSPWALTSISQRQFWKQGLADLGDGRVRGILSVDVSDWKNGESDGRVAWKCTPEELAQEVVSQLRAHLDDDPPQQLHESNLWGAFIDPDITQPNPSETVNAEPLLINTPGSWQYRPTARTQIENLFLAADYVRTDTDLATMEGANEAARRAVNGILERAGRDDLCQTWEWRPPVFHQAGQVLDLVSRASERLPVVGRAPRAPAPADLDGILSPVPGAREADRLLLDAVGLRGPGEPPVPSDRELDTFARELERSPEKTLDAFEEEIERPRRKILDELEPHE
jgi:uncharacterized protein with NAD-binding domain and iron-sulfur cluster